MSKYRSHVERRGFAFSPFGLETYGAWGPRAQGVLQRLVAHAESQSCDDTRSHYSWVASHIRDAAQQLVGVACARGIARALHESALGRVAPTNLDVGDYVERAFAGLHRRASSPPSSPPTRGRGGGATMARGARVPPRGASSQPSPPPSPLASRASHATHASCQACC